MRSGKYFSSCVEIIGAHFKCIWRNSRWRRKDTRTTKTIATWYYRTPKNRMVLLTSNATTNTVYQRSAFKWISHKSVVSPNGPKYKANKHENCTCTFVWIPYVGCGVCARKWIPAGTGIGPYEGKMVRPEDIKVETETEYMWEVGINQCSSRTRQVQNNFIWHLHAVLETNNAPQYHSVTFIWVFLPLYSCREEWHW